MTAYGSSLVVMVSSSVARQTDIGGFYYLLVCLLIVLNSYCLFYCEMSLMSDLSRKPKPGAPREERLGEGGLFDEKGARS
jgi:hypothetical protein